MLNHQSIESGYLMNERARGARSNLTKTDSLFDSSKGKNKMIYLNFNSN